MSRPIAFVAGILVLAVAPAWAQSAAVPKIGVFDGTRVASETKEGKKMQAQLNALRAKKQAEIDAKQQELADLQKLLSGQSLTLSPDKRDQTAKDLQKKNVELTQLRQAAQSDLQLETQDAQQKFGEELMAAVSAYGRDEGFTIIFERSTVFYLSPTIDVTSAVIDRFDAMFPGTPKASPSPAPAAPAKK